MARPTFNGDSVCEEEGTVIYSVVKITGAYSMRALVAVTKGTLPYALKMVG